MNKKILIAIIVVLILLIAGGVLFYFYINTQNNKLQAEVTPSHIQTPTIQHLQKDAQEEEKLSEIGPLYPLDQFTLNLRSDTQGDVYLIVKLDLELSIKELAKELDTKKAVIRDMIIRILSSKTLEGLSSDEGKEKAVDEIINHLNPLLEDGYIKNIYFTKFIVQ